MSFKSFRQVLKNTWKKSLEDSVALDLCFTWTILMLDQIKQLDELSSSNDIRSVVDKFFVKSVSRLRRTGVGILSSNLYLPFDSCSNKVIASKKNQSEKDCRD
ncbi:hypothetical protein ACFE04_018918 [Oxalis oulophora]